MTSVENVARGLLPLRILVIDDDDLVLQMFGRMFKKHTVTLRARAEDALTTIESGDSFDAILCDVRLPGMGGYAFYEALREKCPEAASRVILMTGGSSSRSNEALTDAIPMLTKPFRMKDFQAKLEEVLSARRA